MKQAGGEHERCEARGASMVKFHNLPTLSGNVSFTPEAAHACSGAPYRVIEIEDNKAKFVELVTASSPANIGH